MTTKWPKHPKAFKVTGGTRPEKKIRGMPFSPKLSPKFAEAEEAARRKRAELIKTGLGKLGKTSLTKPVLGKLGKLARPLEKKVRGARPEPKAWRPVFPTKLTEVEAEAKRRQAALTKAALRKLGKIARPKR